MYSLKIAAVIRWLLWTAILVCGLRGSMIILDKIAEGPRNANTEKLWLDRGLIAVPLAKFLERSFYGSPVRQYTFLDTKQPDQGQSLSCHPKSSVDIEAWLYPTIVRNAAIESSYQPSNFEFKLAYEIPGWQFYLSKSGISSREVFISIYFEAGLCKVYAYRG